MGRFDVAAARAHFPALERTVAGRPAVYADGPGGTQTTTTGGDGEFAQIAVGLPAVISEDEDSIVDQRL